MVDTDVFQAIRDNDLQRLKKIANFIESGGSAWNPLHEAAKLGYTELVVFMLKEGHAKVNDEFEIDEQDEFRSGTPLTESLIYGNTETARFLIEYGANVNAAYYGYENTHCFGVEIVEAGNCLTLALAYGDDDLIQLMKSHRLDVNTEFRSEHGEKTAFAYYLECGNVRYMQKLYDLGTDISTLVTDEYFNKVTPLMRSLWLYREAKNDKVKARRLAVIEWLLRHGVDLGYFHKEQELPTALAVVMDADDKELNRLFGVLKPENDNELIIENRHVFLIEDKPVKVEQTKPNNDHRNRVMEKLKMSKELCQLHEEIKVLGTSHEHKAKRLELTEKARLLREKIIREKEKF